MADAEGFIPLQFTRREPDQMSARAREFRELMTARRTVRDFSPEPVPLAVIEDAVRTAGSAPSGANQQPWTFVLVSDADTKQRLREAAEAEERESYANRMSDEWLDAIRPLGTDWQKPHLTDAPHIIVVFAQAYGLAPDPDGGPPRKVKHYYVQESVGIAVGFLLAAPPCIPQLGKGCDRPAEAWRASIACRPSPKDGSK
jgi:iodotyrosine deiodinase